MNCAPLRRRSRWITQKLDRRPCSKVGSGQFEAAVDGGVIEVPQPSEGTGLEDVETAVGGEVIVGQMDGDDLSHHQVSTGFLRVARKLQGVVDAAFEVGG